MSLITLTYLFSAGTTIIASQHNMNNTTIYNDYNGNITSANIAASAGILYSQLALGGNIKNADISSSAAIDGSKLAGLANIVSGAGVIPSANLPSIVSVPSGLIAMWSGSIATIPSGWYLCNGSNGTPDLRDRFVICADADSAGTYNVGQTGSGSIPATTASVQWTYYVSGTSGNNSTASDPFDTVNTKNGNPTTGTSVASVSFGTGSTNVAVYYALAYIMKS